MVNAKRASDLRFCRPLTTVDHIGGSMWSTAKWPLTCGFVAAKGYLTTLTTAMCMPICARETRHLSLRSV